MHTGNAPEISHVQQYEDDLRARHELRRWEQKSRRLQADRAELRRLGGFQEETFAPDRVGLSSDEPSVEELIGALEDATERAAVNESNRFFDWD